MLIDNKDDIEFVTEFPCFLGHPVGCETTEQNGMSFFITDPRVILEFIKN